MSTLNASISTNKVSIFKLTIEDLFQGYFRLIGATILALALIKSVTFFWDTRYEFGLVLKVSFNYQILDARGFLRAP